MKKKVLALLLSMLLVMSACGEGTNANSDSTVEGNGASGGEENAEENGEDISTEVEYVDGVPVFYSWIHDPSLMEEYADVSNIELKTVEFWGYTLDPEEAVEMKLSELVYAILSNAEGTYIFNIGGQKSYIGATQEGKEDYNYNNISVEDMTLEDIQADLARYSEQKEAQEGYDGFYRGEVAIFNSNDLAMALIVYEVRDGIVDDKSLEFIGDENSTIDQDYTTFVLKNKSADVFDGSRSTADDVLVDHSKDGLFTVGYDVEVLEQYGIEVCINEIQWEEEYGASKARINFTFTNNLAYDVGAQPREDLVLNMDGEKVSTFLTWNKTVPAGESLTFDINVKSLGENLGSIEFAFDFSNGIYHITTDVVKLTDLQNGLPTITFSGEMEKVNEKFMEEE